MDKDSINRDHHPSSHRETRIGIQIISIIIKMAAIQCLMDIINNNCNNSSSSHNSNSMDHLQLEDNQINNNNNNSRIRYFNHRTIFNMVHQINNINCSTINHPHYRRINKIRSHNFFPTVLINLKGQDHSRIPIKRMDHQLMVITIINHSSSSNSSSNHKDQEDLLLTTTITNSCPVNNFNHPTAHLDSNQFNSNSKKDLLLPHHK